MTLRSCSICFVWIITCLAACSPARVDHPDWQEYLAAHDVDGCITLYDTRTQSYHRYNAERCRRGFLPASTFKIMNALIALETGVADGPDFVMPWDGVRREYERWNRDHTLHTAMRDSAVWYYQEIARRIGEESMRKHLREARYGNDDLTAGIDRFWLEGGFRITPDEQVEFLRKLRRGALPFAERSQAIVREMMIVEQSDGRTWHAKTGLTRQGDDAIGWWVGWVELPAGAVLYALSITGPAEQVNVAEFIAARQEIVRAILKDSAIVP